MDSTIQSCIPKTQKSSLPPLSPHSSIQSDTSSWCCSSPCSQSPSQSTAPTISSLDQPSHRSLWIHSASPTSFLSSQQQQGSFQKFRIFFLIISLPPTNPTSLLKTLQCLPLEGEREWNTPRVTFKAFSGVALCIIPVESSTMGPGASFPQFYSLLPQGICINYSPHQ